MNTNNKKISEIIGDRHPKGVVAFSELGIHTIGDLFSSKLKRFPRGVSAPAIKKLAEEAFFGGNQETEFKKLVDQHLPHVSGLDD